MVSNDDSPASIARRAHEILSDKNIRLHALYVAAAFDDPHLSPDEAAMLLSDIVQLPFSAAAKRSALAEAIRRRVGDAVTYEKLVEFIHAERR